MLLLLPPSETKRSGGAPGSRLEPGALSFPELARPRRTVLEALLALAGDEEALVRALRLGPRQRGFAAVDRAIPDAPLLPAVERYTGVLYDALEPSSLDAEARARLESRTVVQSALFGLIGAGDRIPEYRLSHDARIPGLRLRRIWADACTAALRGRGFVLDARSEGYAALGPAPEGSSAFLRVVSEGADGRRRALNHFNKRAKGVLARSWAEDAADPADAGELIDWGSSRGFRMERSTQRSGEILLVV